MQIEYGKSMSTIVTDCWTNGLFQRFQNPSSAHRYLCRHSSWPEWYSPANHQSFGASPLNQCQDFSLCIGPVEDGERMLENGDTMPCNSTLALFMSVKNS